MATTDMQSVNALCAGDIPEEDFMAAFSELAVLCAVQDNRSNLRQPAHGLKLMSVPSEAPPPLRFSRATKAKPM